MKIKAEKEEVEQLIVLGLEAAGSPIHLKPGYVAVNLKLAQNGSASFDLVEEGDLDETDD